MGSQFNGASNDMIATWYKWFTTCLISIFYLINQLSAVITKESTLLFAFDITKMGVGGP